LGLASIEMINEVLACLTEGTTIHYLLSLFKDSAELPGHAVRAALGQYREETGKSSPDAHVRIKSRDLLPRHGIQIVVNPRNHRWMVVLYDRSANTLDFDAEVGVLVEEIRVQFGLGESEASTSAILFFLRKRLSAIRGELGRSDLLGNSNNGAS
jgi:hypothetical protein